jgi:hypothetical protein
VSSDGNITYSTLTFTPTLADHGKTLTCRAVNKFIDAAVEEDSWKLNVFCKYDIRRYIYKTLSYSDTSLNVYFSSQIGMKTVRAVFQIIFEIDKSACKLSAYAILHYCIGSYQTHNYSRIYRHHSCNVNIIASLLHHKHRPIENEV